MSGEALWLSSTALLHTICFLLVCLHCLSHRREATSTLLWIFTSLSFPLIGPLLYLTFGIDRVPQKGFQKRVHDEQLLQARDRNKDAIPLAYWRAVTPVTTACSTENRVEQGVCEATAAVSEEFPVLGGNRVLPLVTGDELYPRMIHAIDRAEHHIHLQSFILRNDKTGRMFMQHLAAKAAEGVQVRLLYDSFGSMQAIFTGLFRHYRNTPNLQIAAWRQVNPLKRQFQINLRNHRKNLIIDGTLAFMGGTNLHDENRSCKTGEPIRDYHFETTGPIVQELQYAFMKDWYFMTGEDPDIILKSVYFPSIEPKGTAVASLVCGGPTTPMQPITDVYFMAITSAEKQVLIVTPYFVPTTDILRALRSAAIRGVEIRLILPQNNNHIYADWAGRALYEELLLSGVHIHKRTGPFVHAKGMVIDDRIAIVGSANWDIRSFKLNYETNMTVIDENFANELKRIILEDLSLSEELDLATWNSRPKWHRLVENTCSLMTPVL